MLVLTDAGGFAWTGNQAKEFGLMVARGMKPMRAIHAATAEAEALLDESAALVGIESGKYADIIAVSGVVCKQ